MTHQHTPVATDGRIKCRGCKAEYLWLIGGAKWVNPGESRT